MYISLVKLVKFSFLFLFSSSIQIRGLNSLESGKGAPPHGATSYSLESVKPNLKTLGSSKNV